MWDEIYPDHGPDGDLPHGAEIAVAHVHVRVLHTPGHTPGSVCLNVPVLDVVFTAQGRAAGHGPNLEPVPAGPALASGAGARAATADARAARARPGDDGR